MGNGGFALKVMGSNLLFIFSPTSFSSFDKWGRAPAAHLVVVKVQLQGGSSHFFSSPH